MSEERRGHVNLTQTGALLLSMITDIPTHLETQQVYEKGDKDGNLLLLRKMYFTLIDIQCTKKSPGTLARSSKNGSQV